MYQQSTPAPSLTKTALLQERSIMSSTTSMTENLHGKTSILVEDVPDVTDIGAQKSQHRASHNTADLQSHHSLSVSPLWSMMHAMVPPLPSPKGVPTSWSYNSMRPALMQAASTVTASEAERRVLILVNKSLRPPYTTDTLYGGLQIVLPGETAPAHRHRAFALRFIIEGKRGFTAVEGEKIEMFPGDVILTPSWTWHDHGNEGEDPIIWLDGLDLPLWQFLPINFLEHYSEERYPSKAVPLSENRFAWSAVQRALDQDKQSVTHAVHLYSRSDGSHISRTISAQAERIRVGHATLASQQVYSFIYHVRSGQGATTIESGQTGKVTVVNWKAKDTFAVPAWSKVIHEASSERGAEHAYLFAINDRPIVDALTVACGAEKSRYA